MTPKATVILIGKACFWLWVFVVPLSGPVFVTWNFGTRLS